MDKNCRDYINIFLFVTYFYPIYLVSKNSTQLTCHCIISAVLRDEGIHAEVHHRREISTYIQRKRYESKLLIFTL